MKINIYLGLGVIFAASCICVRADDNPAQAAARAALVKMLMEPTPPQSNSPAQTSPAQTNSPALTTPPPPPPSAPVVPVAPPAVVVPPAPSSAQVSSNPPASKAAQEPGKSRWDVPEQPEDSISAQTNPATAAALVKMPIEPTPPQTSPAQTNSPALTAPPPPSAPVAPVAPPVVVVPPAPSSAQVSTNLPASKAAQEPGKSRWDVPEQPEDSISAQTNPATAAALVKMPIEPTPPQTSPAQTNSPALTAPPPPSAPVVPVAPPAVVVPPAPSSAQVSTNLPSKAAQWPGKSRWDVPEQPADSISAQTNPAPATALAPQTAPAPTVPMPVAPEAVAAPPPAAPIKARPAPVAVKHPAAPAPVKTGTDIVTIYGTVYRNAQVERVEPDGLIISYSTRGGGLGMSEVYFKDLPSEFQTQYQK